MKKEYYTVEEIATLLHIHPKTIQRYIREGKLKATKIGKSWRVTGHELSSFTEGNRYRTGSEHTIPAISVVASSVVDVSVPSKEIAMHIMNTLTASMNAKPLEYGPSSLHTQFIEGERMVRVTLWGDIRFMSVMMDTLVALTT